MSLECANILTVVGEPDYLTLFVPMIYWGKSREPNVTVHHIRLSRVNDGIKLTAYHELSSKLIS
jgi:hypothetical protein